MKLIYATNGGSILVDAVDYDYLSQWSWQVCNEHVVRSQYNPSTKRSDTIYLAHEVAERAGIIHPNQLDHKDQDPLNNQRQTLELQPKVRT